MSGEMRKVFARAVSDGDLTTVQRMLREGAAIVSQTDFDGLTALWLAFQIWRAPCSPVAPRIRWIEHHREI
jgi:hypothetical protein